MVSPLLSKRVAWAMHVAKPSREVRADIAAAVQRAATFEDLPAYVQDMVRAAEDNAPASQEWRRAGRGRQQLTRADLKRLSPEGTVEAHRQGRLRNLMSGN